MNKSLVIVGHGPSLKGRKQGEQIDAADDVCRLKQGFRLAIDNPEDYGGRTDYLCSTLKTWNGYWTLRLKEYWGYQNFQNQDRKMHVIQEHFGKTPIRTEPEAIRIWLARYRELADVRGDWQSGKGAYAKEGDEPWFSTGMGAIVIACAGLKPDVLELAGFDNLWAGEREGFKSVLRDETHMYPPHAWNVERALIDEIAATYGVTICPLRSHRLDRPAGTAMHAPESKPL